MENDIRSNLTSGAVIRSLESEHRELMIGAIEKSQSVVTLTEGLPIHSVLEIGCGTGALLQRLDEAEYGSEYFAIEPSSSRHQCLLEQTQIRRLVTSECCTFAKSTLASRRYDLVILSHVLEHVEDPASLLSAALDVADHVLVEVPLEGQPAVSLRLRLRCYVTGVNLADNAVGHIQFFSRRDVEKLVEWCGAEIVQSRTYVPRPQLQDLIQNGRLVRRLYAKIVLILARLVGETRWANLYYGHHAVLMRHRPMRSKSQRGRWTPSTHYGS